MRPSRDRRITLLLALAACGDDAGPEPTASDPHFAECAPTTAPTCGATPGRSFALAVCGTLSADNTLNVSGPNADVALWVRDDATTSAPLTVQGNYWSATNAAHNSQTISGATLTGASSPSCAWTQPILQTANTQVQISEPTAVVLEGCSYAQPSLEVDNTLEVHIHGDVTWAIAGDLHIAAPMHVVLDPGAHLAWQIGGALEADNTLDIDGPTTLYVAGALHIAAPVALDGSLVAPNSRVEADNTLSISGAAYVGDLHVAAPMHVDGEALLREDGCAP